MNFTSQICTTKEQSERLLALGLKRETADMMYCKTASGELITAKDDDYLEHLDIPAWTLHRLIEMLNYQVIHNGKKYEPIIAIDGMAYQDVCNDDPIVGWSGDLYTDVIDCIEWLIQEGYFNKEYIEHI
jgi:hypothetical protein